VTPYEAPISDRKGQLQAKLYVRGVNYVDAAVGDFFDAQICFDNLNPNLKPTITTIVTGRLLPQ